MQVYILLIKILSPFVCCDERIKNVRNTSKKKQYFNSHLRKCGFQLLILEKPKSNFSKSLQFFRI